MKNCNGKTLQLLFFSMLRISAFTFGGGFVIVTFMKKRFVEDLGWLSEEEMLDMIALAQSSPGPIAVNAAIQMGWKMGGFPGMLCAVLGTILPPMVILSLISLGYQAFASNRIVAFALKGMSCGVAAVILDVAFSMGKNVLKETPWVSGAILLASFVATFFFGINVIWIILAAAVAGMILFSHPRKGGEEG